MLLALILLLVFVALVLLLAYASRRSGTDRGGCCAPADPARDLRMRSAFEDPRS